MFFCVDDRQNCVCFFSFFLFSCWLSFRYFYLKITVKSCQSSDIFLFIDLTASYDFFVLAKLLPQSWSCNLRNFLQSFYMFLVKFIFNSEPERLCCGFELLRELYLVVKKYQDYVPFLLWYTLSVCKIKMGQKLFAVKKFSHLLSSLFNFFFQLNSTQ